MNCTTKLEVTTKTYCNVVKSSFEGTYCKKICECLRWMLMSTIPCIDNRYTGLR